MCHTLYFEIAQAMWMRGCFWEGCLHYLFVLLHFVTGVQMFGFTTVPPWVTMHPSDGFGTLLPFHTLPLTLVSPRTSIFPTPRINPTLRR